MYKVAFLDRDGVINIDYGHVGTWEKFDWVPGSIEAMKKLCLNGFSIIIVTNQSGIARGYYSVPDFLKLMREVRAYLEREGIVILDVFYCPHHTSGTISRFKKDCDCRKPKPGMLLLAQRKHDIDLSNSILIGDSDTDIIAGKSAGVGLCIKVDPVVSKNFVSKSFLLLDAVESVLKI